VYFRRSYYDGRRSCLRVPDYPHYEDTHPRIAPNNPRTRRNARNRVLFVGGIFIGFLRYGPSSLAQAHSTGDIFTTGFSRLAIADRRSVLSNAEGITDPTIAGAGLDEVALMRDATHLGHWTQHACGFWRKQLKNTAAGALKSPNFCTLRVWPPSCMSCADAII
jgi:hypothetical protein